MSPEPENCVGGRVGGEHLYPRPSILVATGRKMRYLIVQSIGWEIGRRRGKTILANKTESSLQLENGTGDWLRDGLWSKKCVCVCVCVHARSHVHTLSCSVISDSDFMDYSPPSSSVQGIFQARVLEQVAISYARGSSRPRDGTCVSCISCIGEWVFHH